MSALTRYLVNTAQAKSGLGTSVIVGYLLQAAVGLITAALFLVAVFFVFADYFSFGGTAASVGMFLGFAALLAGSMLYTSSPKRRTKEQAERALSVPAAPILLLDPPLLKAGLQLGRQRGSGASISRPSSTPTPRSPAPSFTIARRRSRRPICSMTECCRYVKLLRVLTDRGSEFCGNPERHEYELYLAVEDIDHSRTKTKSPQTNGICERFHKTVLNELYRVAFRKKVYRSIDELQADLDSWIKEYNEVRPHQGVWWLGKTPMQTFLDAIPMTKEK
jgi:hypothetical protein